MPPPPKSPTRLSGGTGASPARPMRLERAGQRDVVDVVARPCARTDRPGPSRSCGRRRASGCGRGTRRARGRGARRRRAGTASNSASACSTSRSTSLDAVGVLQVDADRAAAAAAARRPAASRVAAAHAARRGRSRMTSAPMSASMNAQNGPGPMPASSMILMPVERSAHRSCRSVRPSRGASAVIASMIWRPEHRRQVVAHALDIEQLGAGMSSAVRSPAGDVDERIDGAVDHERRHVELPERVGSRARCQRCRGAGGRCPAG